MRAVGWLGKRDFLYGVIKVGGQRTDRILQ